MATEAPLLVGDHLCAKLGPIRMWAERGLIHCEDSRDNSYKSMFVKTALHRCKALANMLTNSKGEKVSAYNQFILKAELRLFLDTMIQVIDKARAQGMPDDPNDSMHNARRAARPVSVSVAPYDFD